MNNRIKILDFFIIRNPRLPYLFLDRMNSSKTEEEFWEFAIQIVSIPQVLDSIFIASEEFYSQLLLTLASPFDERTKKLLPSLYKYISRMANRPTPFGKFSTISLGSISNNGTELILSNQFNSRYRLDQETLQLITKTVLKDRKALEKICFFPNTTLLTKDDYFSYIDFVESNGRPSFNWSRVGNNVLIKMVMDSCSNGKSYAKIKQVLLDLGISQDKSINFINELIKQKLLIPENEPVTTTSSANKSLFRIQEIVSGTSLALPINELSKYVEQAQKEGIITSNSHPIASLIDLFQVKPKNLIQVDMSRDLEQGNLSTKHIQTLTNEVLELQCLSRKERHLDLEYFITRFPAKYGDQEVFLLDALNQELGIGYGSTENIVAKNCPLLEGLIEERGKEEEHKKNLFYQKVFDKQYSSNNSESISIALNEKDLSALGFTKNDKFRLPLGFYLIGNILNLKDAKSPDEGLRFNLSQCGGVSALPLLTRFSYLDNNIQHHLVKCAEAEQHLAGDIILAEIVFSPMGKAGNILSRPSLYKYEIPIIGQSAVDEEHTILLSDLLVSVVKGRIVLRSQKLNKIIIPRLSSAHNFHYGMTIYRFLCDLQFQDNPINLGWDWGTLSKRKFLPRITYKHLILSRARWYIVKDIFKDRVFNNDDEKVSYLISLYNLPNKVLLVQGDNEMLIDLRNEIGFRILLKELNKRDLALVENLYDSFESPVRDTEGNTFTNEIIIPILGEPISQLGKISYQSSCDIVRKHIPGSEWLYLKIYCGEKDSDSILREHIQPLIKVLKKDGLINKWFFIRYHDPESHIRIRFNLSKILNHSFTLVSRYIWDIFGNLTSKGKVSRILFDTYERELERYGPDNMENCESIFDLESDMILRFLPLVKLEGEQLRWKFAMAAIDSLFSAFGYTEESKIAFLEILIDGFFSEFEKYQKLKYTLDQNYRKNAAEIFSFFQQEIYSHETITSLLRNHKIAMTAFAEICQTSSDFIQKPNEIISSLAHMLLNRVFYTKQREQEMVIYYFLFKYLKAQLKRSNNQSFPIKPNLL